MEGGPLAGLQTSLSSILPGKQAGGGHGGAARHLNPMQFGRVLGGGGEAAGGAAAGGEAAAGGLSELAPLALAAL